MSSVVAIGGPVHLEGYTLAGVRVIDAADRPAAQRAWDELTADVALVLLDAAAQEALADRLSERPVLWVVVPE